MPRLVIREGATVGRDHALGGPCVLGRHPGADFVLDDDLASRRHARVRLEDGVWVLEDLDSTNGTRVNGRAIHRQPLVDGDRIRVGGTELVFVQKDLLSSPGRAADRRPKTGEAPRRRRRRR